jgi:hypothetical protein
MKITRGYMIKRRIVDALNVLSFFFLFFVLLPAMMLAGLLYGR